MFKGTVLELVVVDDDDDEEEDEDAVLVTFATYTWFGVETVSEKIAKPPFCETPISLPVISPNSVPGAGRTVNALEVLPRLPGLSTAAPYWLPM
ncbi:MAG: hypothetical protein WAK56_12105, partial [Candidatus Sulfotelmatobacter sp.]